MSILNITPTAQADTLNPVQTELVAMAEKISSTPADVLIEDLLNKAVTFGLKVLAAILIYLLGAWMIRKIKRILKRLFERRNTDPAIASFVQSILSIAMTIMLIIITVGALGVDTTSLAALLAGGGMAIGMALNGTVQNFAGGIMILAFRPFQSGDYIQFEEFEGTVSEVNIVSTKLTTTDNRTIIIPNGALSNGTINNFSHNKVRRVEWIIDVAILLPSDIQIVIDNAHLTQATGCFDNVFLRHSVQWRTTSSHLNEWKTPLAISAGCTIHPFPAS